MSQLRKYVMCHLLVTYQNGDRRAHFSTGQQTLLLLRQHFVQWNKRSDNKRSPTICCCCCTFVLGDVFQVGALRSSFRSCINYMDQLSSECTPSKCHIDHLKGTSACIPLMSYRSPAETLPLASAKPVHRRDSIRLLRSF